MNQTKPKNKADYGIDGPPIIRNFVLSGVAFFVLGGIMYLWLNSVHISTARVFFCFSTLVGIVSFLSAGLMVRSSIIGKLLQREKLMDMLELHGDEIVVDIGCGSGLLLNAAAKRLTTGKAVGLDLWNKEDLSDNRPERTLTNAAAEGVADRIELTTGDMQNMPFPDETFDIAVASMALHNIRNKEGRINTVREIARVLKPGGHVAIQDFSCINEYVQTLRNIGWINVERSGLKAIMWPPVRVVTGRKPI